jgi:hypothetical protein
MNRTNRKSGLTLTPLVFDALHKALILTLKENYKVAPETLMDYQLYGFNYYDENLPSIKKLILDKTGKWVNGKYLYNKYRAWKNGASAIKLTREFVFIYFKTLGYRDVQEFLYNSALSNAAIEEQINLEKPIVLAPINEYYVGYYIGEEDNIIITKLTLSERNLKAQWALAYWEKEEAYSEYFYEGIIQYQQNGMSLIFKNEDTILDRSLFISIFCERQIKVKPFLIGGYSGYDRDRQPVVGEVIFQRVASEAAQIALLTSKKVAPIIAQRLAGKRWIINGKNPQNLIDLSSESKFADTIEKFVRNFKGIFVAIENGVFIFELTIRDNLGNATLSIAGHPIYNGVFKVQASGQLLIGQFINSTTKAPLFMSIEVLPIREQIYTGDLLGISRFDKSFSGKIYLSSHEQINKVLPTYRGSELSPSEIQNLPSAILDDLTGVFKNNRLEKHFQESEVHTSNNYIAYLAGNYTFLFLDENKEKKKALLTLTENGLSNLQIHHLNYQGQAKLCEGFVLSIYFESCNGIPHCGQIMGRIGRKSKAELDCFEASWHYLDADFQAKTKTVIICSSPNQEIERKAYEQLKAKKKN